MFYNFRHPDLGRNPFGTSHERVDHSRAGLGMAEGLLGQVIQERSNGFVLQRIGHVVEPDRQGVCKIIGLDIGTCDKLSIVTFLGACLRLSRSCLRSS